MKRIPLLAALGLFGLASPACAFGPAAAQPVRVFVGPIDRPMVCLPAESRGACSRIEVLEGDSNESERHIARLFQRDTQARRPRLHDRR